MATYIFSQRLASFYFNKGCFSHDGSDYRGNATHTDKGVPCIKWTDALDINPTTYPSKVRICDREIFFNESNFDEILGNENRFCYCLIVLNL